MAKRFRFRLDTLLRVRQLRQREAQRKVAAKHAEIARLDRLDEQTAREISNCQTALRAGQQRGTLDVEVLSQRRAWVAHLRRLMLQRQAWRAGLANELKQLQSELRTARTQTRMLEKLRQRRWDEYVRGRNRREQSEADELAQQLQVFGHASAATGAGST